VWLERLDAEAGNLAAAVRWYLAHDPGPLPHLFRVLWLFWLQRDLEGPAGSWVERFRAAGPLDVQARAELAPATGFSRPPRCSWASWLSCGAGSMRPGR
jgi:hypothetical protein